MCILRMQTELFVMHCTAKHKQLLHFTTYNYITTINTTASDLEHDYTNTPLVYGFPIN